MNMKTGSYLFAFISFFLPFEATSNEACDDIQDFQGGEIIFLNESRIVGATAIFSCYDAYSLYPPDVDESKCGPDLIWNPPPPKCFKKASAECPSYSDCHGTILLNHNESLTINCHVGYEIYNKKSGTFTDQRMITVTNNDGIFRPPVPMCREERCNIDDLNHAIVTSDGVPVRGKVPSGLRYNITCADGYEFESVRYRTKQKVSDLICCERGSFYRKCKDPKPVIKCVEEGCIFDGYPKNQHTKRQLKGEFSSFLLDNDYIPHGEKVEYSCQNEDYVLYVQSTSTYLQTFTATCHHGTFDKPNNTFPLCLERQCNISSSANIQASTCYQAEDDYYVSCRTTDFQVRSGSVVIIRCKEGYELVNSTLSYTDEEVANITCDRGYLLSEYSCKPRRCDVSNVPTNDRTIQRATKNILVNARFIESGETIEYICESEDYELYVEASDTVLSSFQTKCAAGKLDKQLEEFPVCVEKRCLLQPQNGVCYSTDNFAEQCAPKSFIIGSRRSAPVTCQVGYLLYEDGSNVPTASPAKVECIKGKLVKNISCKPAKGCEIPSDKYLYSSGEMELNPGAHIEDQTTVTIRCRHLEFFDYDYNTKTSGTEEKIKCEHGHLQSPSINCTEGESKECTTLANGLVRKRFLNEYEVSCNEGYALNLFRPEFPHCECKDNGLVCKYGRQTPVCEPVPCKIPRTIDDQLTMFKRSGGKILYLSAGLIVAIGEKVFFNCMGFEDLEPNNRRFKCQNGKWLEDEKNADWRLGNNGDFPTCRNASCVQPCQNGGKCVRDDTCQCPHLTKGSLCEEFMCDKDCFMNNGSCIGPGICGDCPPGCRGDNCVLEGCEPPTDVPQLRMRKDCFKVGDVISSTEFECPPGTMIYPVKEMKCQNSGTWTKAVECKEGCKPPTDVPRVRMHNDFFNVGDVIPSTKFECPLGTVVYPAEGIKCQSLGMWTKVVECKEGCQPPTDVPKVRMNKDFFNVGDLIPSMEFECPLGFVVYPSEGMRCQSVGNWTKAVECKDRQTVCEIPSDKYQYSTEKELNLTPGSIVDDQTKLIIRCRYTDMLDYDLYGNLDTKDEIKCVNARLEAPSLHCPEGDPKDCTTLENGSVKKRFFNQYEVSCDEGYALNLYRPEHPHCECKVNGLVCQYGKQTPVCKPVPCKIPTNIDSRLTVFKRNDEKIVYLSSELIIAVGDQVYVNCTGTDSVYLEPNNRCFKCKNGKWLVDDIAGWKFENNGNFPTCRKASCLQPCQNGGKCIRDDSCFCPDQTEGKQCEHFLCDKECLENLGSCIGPGKCGRCPSGRHGDNCKLKVCEIAFSKPRVRAAKKFYQVGETIHSSEFDCHPAYKAMPDEGITCLQNGKWSGIVQCVRQKEGCEPPTGTPNIHQPKDFYNIGDVIRSQEFECRPGTVAYPADGMTCQSAGKWTQTLECIDRHNLPDKCNTFVYKPDVYPFKHGDRTDSHFIGHGAEFTESVCRERCLGLKIFICNGFLHMPIYYEDNLAEFNCYLFSNTDQRDFVTAPERKAKYFHRSCQIH